MGGRYLDIPSHFSCNVSPSCTCSIVTNHFRKFLRKNANHYLQRSGDVPGVFLEFLLEVECVEQTFFLHGFIQGIHGFGPEKLQGFLHGFSEGRKTSGFLA